MRHHLVHGQIGLRVVFGLTADDQRRARLVNQDRVDLVNNRVIEFALHPVGSFVNHVVAQVIKSVLVVGTVSDIALVSALFFFARQLRQIDTDTQAEKVIQTAHPLRVPVGQVVVDRHHVYALAAERIQVHRQSGCQRFTFTGAHLGNLALVQGHAT